MAIEDSLVGVVVFQHLEHGVPGLVLLGPVQHRHLVRPPGTEPGQGVLVAHDVVGRLHVQIVVGDGGVGVERGAQPPERDLPLVGLVGRHRVDGDRGRREGQQVAGPLVVEQLHGVHAPPTPHRRAGVTGLAVPSLEPGAEGGELEVRQHRGDALTEAVQSDVEQVGHPGLGGPVQLGHGDDGVAVVLGQHLKALVEPRHLLGPSPVVEGHHLFGVDQRIAPAPIAAPCISRSWPDSIPGPRRTSGMSAAHDGTRILPTSVGAR